MTLSIWTDPIRPEKKSSSSKSGCIWLDQIRSDGSDQMDRQNKLLSGNRKCPTHLERPEGRQAEQESGKSVFVPTMVPEGGEHSVGERLHLSVRL